MTRSWQPPRKAPRLFVRLSPLDKQRIIKALQKAGSVVGFLGDGINDSPALARRRCRRLG